MMEAIEVVGKGLAWLFTCAAVGWFLGEMSYRAVKHKWPTIDKVRQEDEQ